MSDNPARAQNEDHRKNDAELAYIDDLTGLYNRRYLNINLPRELIKAKEQKSAFSLFMIDLDNFKGINDTYGHLNGDKVLVDISDVLKKEMGSDGISIRYAGDEFTVLLSAKSLNDAVLIGNRLLHAISQHKPELKSGKKVENFSLSIGIAVYPDDADTAETLIDKADQALYSAKRMGKNRLATVSDIIGEALDRDLALNALPCKKFIDRETEIEYLKKAREDAQNGAKKYILIKGGDGVGKTRLMLEVLKSGKTDPKTFLLKCRKEDIYQQYGAVALALSGYHAPAKDLSDTDAFNNFTSVIRKSGQDKIVILVDDILWIDEGSLKVLQWVLESKEFKGALVVATMSRDALKADRIPDAPFLRFTSAKAAPQPEILDLEPLSESASSELLKAVFPGLVMPADLNKKIYQTSGGYPSIIEETIKYMLNAKIAYPRGGKWVLDEKNIGSVPSSIGELLDKFISELDNDTREILSKAAVLGNDFNIDILKSLYGKNEGQLIDTLDNLRRIGVLEGSTSADGNTLSFMNTAVREGMYNAIRKTELQRMHKRAAELIKDYYKSDISAGYGELKYHLREAGEEEVATTEREPSQEEIAERPLSENSMKIAANVIILMRAAWLNSRLYPLDNKTCVDSIENLNNDIATILNNNTTLTITISGEDALINGEAVNKKKLSVTLSRALGSLFAEYGISSITFNRGLAKKELESFFSIVLKDGDPEKTGTFAKLLNEKNVTNIKVDEVRYRKASEFKSGRNIKNSALVKLIAENPALNSLLSVGENGIEINPAGNWDGDKKHLTDAFLAVAPAVPPEELKDFVKAILKSHNLKDIPLAEIHSIFKKAGIDKDVIAMATAENTSPEPFFDDMAKKFIGSGKGDALENKVISNLGLLTEALIIKGDTKTLEDLGRSLLTKLDSESPSVRMSAAEGIGKVLNVLLEKEVFDIAARIITGLSQRLKTEENLKVYTGILKDFESTISTLIQKQRPSLLVNPLLALKEESGPDSLRSDEFKRHVNATIRGAMTSENMNILFLTRRGKTDRDYGIIMDVILQFKGELIPSLLGVLVKKDDMKWDPFDIYMKKQNVVAVIKKIGEDVMSKLSDMVNDKRPHVAENALEIFGYINDAKYLSCIEPAMLHSDKGVRKAALDVVRKLSGGNDTVKILVRILPKERDRGLVSRITDMISELTSPSLVPYVKNELKGKIGLDDYDKLIARLAGKK